MIAMSLSGSAAAGTPQAMPPSVGERARALVHAVQRSSLVQVIENSTWTATDRQLLRMMAEVMEDRAAMQLLPEEAHDSPSLSSSGSNAFAYGTLHLDNSAEAYTLTFSNDTSEDLDEVVVFWQKKDGVMGSIQFFKGLPAGNNTVFILDACPEMWRYTVGIFSNGQRIFRIPPDSGSMTPELASQINPSDTYPCADSWRLHEDRR